MPKESAESAQDGNSGADHWPNQLGVVVAVSIVAVVYALITDDWSYAGKLALSTAFLATVIIVAGRLRARKNRRRSHGTAQDLPPV
ncbi:hypothetical protein [Cryptosporangium sp. NPDC051539]|uniref:hypothetical protein n=1 Tax=Cryptosporangium sp. NPDC051539 TaxID=3363962 RepID=UPI00378D03F0